MKNKHSIRIFINPQNPVQYLACCGIFEIASRFNLSATSYWNMDSQPFFLIESDIEEAFLLHCLTNTLSDWSQWKFEICSVENVISQMNVFFSLNTNEKKFIKLTLDWWYESIRMPSGEIEKSAWKMYSGQQTVEKISRDMVSKIQDILKDNNSKTISDLLTLNSGMTGRFGLDPRSSRNALDVGFSANDLGLETQTFPVVELLAVIGTQFFFPHRTKISAKNTSTRGWIDDSNFRYGLWLTPQTTTLAKIFASRLKIVDKPQVLFMNSVRLGQYYSNLTMATLSKEKQK